MNSPVLTSHSMTVPSSELVITKRELNCKHVTADWCLLGPDNVCKHWPVMISHTLTVAAGRFQHSTLSKCDRCYGYDDIAGHLRLPDATRVTDQCSKALSGDGGPHFERVVVRTGHDPVAAELKARDDVVVVALQHLGGAYRSRAPVHLDERMLSHVSCLPRRRNRRHISGLASLWSIPNGHVHDDAAFLALFFPHEAIVC